MKNKCCHLCCTTTEKLPQWPSCGVSSRHSLIRFVHNSFNKEPDTKNGQKSLLSRGNWTPRVQPQSAFRVVTPWKSHCRGQRLMGSCGNEMDGWVSWLGAARTEKGCAAQRREATSNDCKNRYRPKMYIFKVVQDQTVWHNSDKEEIKNRIRNKPYFVLF